MQPDQQQIANKPGLWLHHMLPDKVILKLGLFGLLELLLIANKLGLLLLPWLTDSPNPFNLKIKLGLFGLLELMFIANKLGLLLLPWLPNSPNPFHLKIKLV
jgi:hypothetical protein